MSLYEQIRLVEPIGSFSRTGFVHPIGTTGILMKHEGGGYASVELRALEFSRWYEVVTLHARCFERTGWVVIPCANCGMQIRVDQEADHARTLAFTPLSDPSSAFEAKVMVCGDPCVRDLRRKILKAGTSFQISILPIDTAKPS